MRAPKRTWIPLLVWIVICSVGTSCKPSGTQTTPEKSKTRGSGGQNEIKKTELSREQIINIADKVARDHNRDPEQMKVVYDDGNATWRRIPESRDVDFPDHDFQVVVYWRRPPVAEGGLWVLVDRNAGEVLKVVEPD
jgi:hypothetical protein